MRKEARNYEIKVFNVNTGSLSLKYPTWFPLSRRTKKTIMSLTQDNQKILVHGLVRCEET